MSPDYNGPERRTPPDAMRVNLDQLSNGARTLLESAIDEAKRTRRWIVGSLLVIAAFLVAAGEFRGTTLTALEVRPTDSQVRAIVDSVEVLRDMRYKTIIETLNDQQLVLERLAERSRATLERLDQLEDEH